MLATSVVLLLSAGPLAAQADGIDPFVTCAVGQSTANVELPVGDQPGSIQGFLVDETGRQLAFQAALIYVRTTDGILRGQLEGTVHALKNNGDLHHKPLAAMTGTWVAGPLGRGRIHATITELVHGNSKKTVAATGKMAGEFMPPATAFTLKSVFLGRWMICR